MTPTDRSVLTAPLGIVLDTPELRERWPAGSEIQAQGAAMLGATLPGYLASVPPASM